MFYKNNLNTEAGKNAISYLNERKITKNIIDEFNIGLSLNDRTALYNILNKKGFNNVEIENDGNNNENSNNGNIVIEKQNDSTGGVVIISSTILSGGIIGGCYIISSRNNHRKK